MSFCCSRFRKCGFLHRPAAIPLHRTCEQLIHTSQCAKRVSAEFIDEPSNMWDMLQDSRALLPEMA